MKYPLDRICVKSGILCPRCQRLVDTGVVKEYEIPIMKELILLEESKYKELRQKGTYHKSYRSNNLVIVVVDGIGNPRILEKLSKELSSKLGLRVKVVERKGDQRLFIEQIVHPATLLGVNTLWLPDGTEQIVVRIYRRDYRIIGPRKEDYEKILGQIFGKAVRIRFE